MATLLDLTNRVKGEMGLSTGEYTITVKGGDIASVADYSGTESGTVLITDVAHGLETGDEVTITGTTHYNSTAVGAPVTKVDADTFYITETYTSSQTGKWVSVIENDQFIVNDVRFVFILSLSTSLEYPQIGLTAGAGKNGVATLIKDWINGAFSQSVTGSSVLASSSSNVVTVTGASKVYINTTASRSTTSSGTPIQQLNKALAINTVSSEDEPPSTSDLLQFIKDAQYDLLNKLDENVFSNDVSGEDDGLVRLIDFSNTTNNNVNSEQYADTNQIPIAKITHLESDNSDNAVDIVKIFELSYKSNTKSTDTMTVKDTKTRAEKVPFDLLQDIREGRHSFYNSDAYSDTVPVQKFYSIVGNMIELSHPLDDDTTDVQNLSLVALCKPNELVTDTCSFPEHIHDLIVMYAKAKGYELVNRFDISQNIINNYNQLIGVLNLKHSSKQTTKFEKEIPKI